MGALALRPPIVPGPGLLISRSPSLTPAGASWFVGSDCTQGGLPDVAISPDVVSFIHLRLGRRDLLQRGAIDNVVWKASSVGCQRPLNETYQLPLRWIKTCHNPAQQTPW
jgi:hypothetical protein